VSPFLRFTLLRFTLLAAVAGVLYLLGARGVLWLGLTAVMSTALSYVLLRNVRDQLARSVDDRLSGRVQQRSKLQRQLDDDDAAEDAAAKD